MYLTKVKLEEAKIEDQYSHPQLVSLESVDDQHLAIIYSDTSLIPNKLVSNKSIHLYKLIGYEGLHDGPDITVLDGSAVLVTPDEINLDIDYSIYSIPEDIFKIKIEEFLSGKLNKFLESSDSLYTTFIESAVGKFDLSVDIKNNI